ncbi:hypothetical protein ND748_07310 [Frankia sp. AiPs1]|uniref:hypothetical protein n=1 Tax=Frankia sp. AiPs1 TaxID=573493 RepID=UPI002042DD77|nr:hypothetical protein [Frankia sp. AiPs1]MCM3921475.1 hypothetical protein [Frankia sp. AiPs1]
MSDSGGSGGLLGNRAVAFWTVVAGIIAAVTFSVSVVTRLTNGPDRPIPSPPISGPVSSSPGVVVGPTPSPTYPVRTRSPKPYVLADSTPASSLRPPAATTPAGPRPLRYTFAGASQYPCSSEGHIRSLFQAPVQLLVENGSSQLIQLYYLDAAGNRIAQTTIASGRSVSVSSHLGDAWLPATSQADCIGIFALRANSRLQFLDAR